MAAIVAEECEVMVDCRRANEQIEIADEHTSSAQPPPFFPEDFTHSFIDTERPYPAEKIIEVLLVALRVA
jgi:hypothetical protein